MKEREISKIAILQLWEAKNLTRASPIPDAPPGYCQCVLQMWTRGGSELPVTITVLPVMSAGAIF